MILQPLLSSPLQPLLRDPLDPMQGTGFSPLSLFAGGEIGTWQSRRDLSSMWIDNLAVTQLTAPGQTIGFAADKSKGMARSAVNAWQQGPAPSNGWTPNGDGTYTHAPGTGGSYGGASSNITVNRFYEATFTVTGQTTGGVRMILGSGVGPYLMSNGPYRAIFLADGTSTFLNAQAAFDGIVSNVSILEFLGNHATQATPPARPLYQVGPQRGVMDGVDDVLNTPFPSSLGNACTVARAIPGVGAQILTGQTIGTSYADTVTSTEFIIVNRALTAGETASLTAWLNAAVL